MAVWARMSYFQGYAEMWSILLTRSKCARVWKLKVWGMKGVWFGYDSRRTIQHNVSDLDRSYNGQSAPEAGRCKQYQLHNEATAASQHRSCLQPTWLHRAARLRGWRAGWRKGRLKAAWSKCRDPWSPNNNHQQALKNDLHFGGLLRGMLRGYASGRASGVCFARAPPSTNTYLGPRKKY